MGERKVFQLIDSDKKNIGFSMSSEGGTLYLLNEDGDKISEVDISQLIDEQVNEKISSLEDRISALEEK